MINRVHFIVRVSIQPLCASLYISAVSRLYPKLLSAPYTTPLDLMSTRPA